MYSKLLCALILKYAVKRKLISLITSLDLTQWRAQPGFLSSRGNTATSWSAEDILI